MTAQEFSFQLMRMQALFHRRLMKNLEPTDLSTGQPKVLAFLRSHEGYSQKEIAQACLLEPGSVTVLLKRMEQQGIVERRRRDGDRKSRSIFLTERGRALANASVVSFFRTEELAFAGFTEEEKNKLTEFCDRIVNNLQNG